MLSQFQCQLSVEESALNVWHFIINLVVNQSTACAKDVELVLYKVGQSLLQPVERITKCGNFITKWDKHNYTGGHVLQKKAALL